MDTDEVERLIEAGIEGAEARVTPARGPHDDDHLAAEVVAPAFEGVPIVERHDMVHDALEDHLTTAIHAIEVTAYTPDEFEDG